MERRVLLVICALYGAGGMVNRLISIQICLAASLLLLLPLMLLLLLLVVAAGSFFS